MAARLRPADHLMLPAVRKTVSELALEELDLAAVRLAELLAIAIDEAHPDDRVSTLRDLSPKLLAVLVELGATPKQRAAVKGGGATPDAPTSSLERLRSARRQ